MGAPQTGSRVEARLPRSLAAWARPCSKRPTKRNNMKRFCHPCRACNCEGEGFIGRHWCSLASMKVAWEGERARARSLGAPAAAEQTVGSTFTWAGAYVYTHKGPRPKRAPRPSEYHKPKPSEARACAAAARRPAAEITAPSTARAATAAVAARSAVGVDAIVAAHHDTSQVSDERSRWGRRAEAGTHAQSASRLPPQNSSR